MKLNKNLQVLVPIVIIILIGTFGFMIIYASNPYMELTSLLKTLMNGSNKGQPAPEFVGLGEWLNTPNGQPLTIQELQGKVVLIDFWTYSCINCQRDIPQIVEWDKEYRDQGLVIIGIHTPEFRYEQKLENVVVETAKLNIQYAVALDNGYKTWRAYRTHFWPTKYLIDTSGKIVDIRFGEGAYEETEALIVELLQNVDPEQSN